MVRDFHSKFFIVRTSWVFGVNGNNFVKTMLELSKKKEQLKVVNDQIGSPTYTIDLSKCIFQLMESNKYGIYHVSNSGSCSWFEFAKEIFNQIKKPIKSHNTFLALKCQRNSPSTHCLRRLLYETCFGKFCFSLMFSPICCADNATLDLNES